MQLKGGEVQRLAAAGHCWLRPTVVGWVVPLLLGAGSGWCLADLAPTLAAWLRPCCHDGPDDEVLGLVVPGYCLLWPLVGGLRLVRVV